MIATAGRLGRRVPWRSRAVLDGCLGLALVGYLLWTAATFLGRLSWLFDITTHFRPHLLAVGALLAVMLIAARRPWWVVPLAVAASVHAAVLLRPVPVPAASGPGPALRLTEFNLWADNTEFGPVLDYLRSQRPDVLVTVEAVRPWQQHLRQLSDLLPFNTMDRLKRPTDLETVVMSRFPIKGFSVEMPREPKGAVLGIPVVRVVLDVGGTDVVLWAVHPPNPLNRGDWRARNTLHLWVAGRVAAEDPSVPVIVAGDFNQTPWTPWHQQFLERSGLLDAAGTSWPAPTRQPYWPFGWRLLAIPIDRVAVRPGTGVSELQVGPFLGSDHFPVTADLVLGRPPAPLGRDAAP
jgi:endonuclease/exonuclease/phosphatase (EEP) superfamily protein YafD